MNPMDLFKMKSAFEAFKNQHPKFIQFTKVVGEKGIQEGTVIDVAVTTPEGEKYNANLRVTQSDMELLQKIKNLQN